MIAIQFQKRDFEYDVYNLVKSFYPEEEIVLSDDDSPAAEYDEKISLFYGKNKISIRIERVSGERKRQEEGVWLTEEMHGRKERKNQTKILLYHMLQKRTGQELPWGTLTGVRPTKIPMALIDAGHSNVETAKIMREQYLVSREKTALAVSIANRERHILEDIDYKNGYSLYIGIPFCPTICAYCSFSSSPLKVWKNKVDDYLDALCHEIRETASMWAGQVLDTIYIGGGTPTTLEPHQLERLLSEVEKCFDISHIKEYTVEAGRPDSITVHSLAIKRAARLNLFKDEYKEMTFTNNQRIMEMTEQYAAKAGMFPYYLYRQKNMKGNFENVGYAKPEKEGIYNILIMEEKQSILALGAGASTKFVMNDRIERAENVKDIKNYIERIDEMIERKKQGYCDYEKNRV